MQYLPLTCIYKYSFSDSDWSLYSKKTLFRIVLPALSLTTVAARGQKQISHKQNSLELYTGSSWLKLPSGLTVWLVKHIYTRWLHSHCSSTCTEHRDIPPSHVTYQIFVWALWTLKAAFSVLLPQIMWTCKKSYPAACRRRFSELWNHHEPETFTFVVCHVKGPVCRTEGLLLADMVYNLNNYVFMNI